MCLHVHVHVQTCQTAEFDNSTKSHANFLIHSFLGHPILLKVSMGILFYLIQRAVVGLLTYGWMNIEQIHTPIYIRDQSAFIEIFEYQDEPYNQTAFSVSFTLPMTPSSEVIS